MLDKTLARLHLYSSLFFDTLKMIIKNIEHRFIISENSH